MTTTKDRRMDQVGRRLTPKQIVLKTLKQYASGTMAEFGERVLPLGAGGIMAIVCREASEAVRASMKGQPEDQIRRREREARMEAAFLVNLKKLAALEIITASREKSLTAALLASEIKDILELDSVSNEMARIRNYMAESVPYPLDRETADAVEAEIRHAVATEEVLSDCDFDEWFREHFKKIGKTSIPTGAYTRRQEEKSDDERPDAVLLEIMAAPSKEDIRKLFATDQDFDLWWTGQEYQWGFADVHDEEVQAAFDRMMEAVEALAETGKIRKARQVEFYDEDAGHGVTMNGFFQYASLVDDKWIDLFAVELAELAAVLLKAGFALVDEDDHFMAWRRILAPKDIESEEQEAKAVEGHRQKVKAHLAKFKGRTKKIDGRTYLDFDDYSAWKGRAAKIRTFDGIVVASWNAWIDSQKGKAELAGAKVGKLEDHPLIGAGFQVHEGERAKKLIRDRQETVARMHCWHASKIDVEGKEYVQDRVRDGFLRTVLPVRLHGMSYKTRVAEFRSHAMAHAGEVFQAKTAVDMIAKKFFDGMDILQKDVRERAEADVRDLRTLIDAYNETVAFRLDKYSGKELLTGERPGDDKDLPLPYRSGFKIDLDEVRKFATPTAKKKAEEIIVKARVDTLQDFGDLEEAERILRPMLEESLRTLKGYDSANGKKADDED